MKRMKKTITAIIVICMLVTMIAQVAMAATITINGTSDAPLAGRTFNAYKVFGLEKSGTAYLYSVEDDWKNFFVTKYSLDANDAEFDVKVANNVVAITAAEDIQAFAEELNAYVAQNTITATDSVTVDDDSVETSVSFDENNLTSGYYLITDETTADSNEVVSAVMLQNFEGTGDVEVTIKADKPTIIKKIWEDTNDDGDVDNGELLDANTANVGDTVEYQLGSEIPDMVGYTTYTYTVSDTLSEGLTLNENSIKVSIGGLELTKVTDYTLATSANEFTLTMNLKSLVDKADDDVIVEGAKIVVEYDATVNEKAVTGVTGNTNTVTLTYSNDPADESKTTVTPEDTVITYLTEVKVAKVDQDGNALSGAEFKIEGNGVTYTVKTETVAGVKTVTVSTDDITNDATNTTTAEVDANGYLVFKGLGAGEYTITETNAPAGYKKLETAINIVIGCELPDEVTSATDECEWSYGIKDGATIEGVETSGTGIYTLTVTNKANASLFPETGGIGTTIFVVVGVALMVMAVVLFAIKKKASAK